MSSVRPLHKDWELLLNHSCIWHVVVRMRSLNDLSCVAVCLKMAVDVGKFAHASHLYKLVSTMHSSIRRRFMVLLFNDYNDYIIILYVASSLMLNQLNPYFRSECSLLPLEYSGILGAFTGTLSGLIATHMYHIKSWWMEWGKDWQSYVAVEVRKRTLFRKLILRKWRLKFPNDFDVIVVVVLDSLLCACKTFNGYSARLWFMCVRRCIE